MKYFNKPIVSLVISLMIWLPFSAQAGMVSTNQAISSSQGHIDKVQDFLKRSDVAATLESMGVNSKNAQDRAKAMTQEEINLVSNEIDSIPAGGYITEVGGVIIGVTLIIVIALLTRNEKSS